MDGKNGISFWTNKIIFDLKTDKELFKPKSEPILFNILIQFGKKLF